MLGIIFTLDYEIYGNGCGSPYKLMIKPTKKIIKLFDNYGAKLTIMADACQIIKYKEYYDLNKVDKFYYKKIERQLQDAIKNSHDVQLHTHSSFLNAEYKNNYWHQDWNEYDLANLNYERIYEIIKLSKNYLDKVLKEVNIIYNCNVFRAANWSMNPSENIVRALLNNNIDIDSSIFKYGKRTALVNFNYKDAYSNIVPWPVNEDNICLFKQDGKLFEFPIYCEKRKIYSFITILRLIRLVKEILYKNRVKYGLPVVNNEENNNKKILTKIYKNTTKMSPWKLDFNVCTGKQMINTLRNIEKKYNSNDNNLPIVMIGHSKLYNVLNKYNLEMVLQFVKANKDRYFIAKFNDFEVNAFRTNSINN